MSRSLEEKVIQEAIQHWISDPCGISALSLSNKLDVPHADVLKAVEFLASSGKGTLHRNVELHTMSMNLSDLDNPIEFHSTPTITHIFFPSPTVLTDYFYSSDLCRRDLPEYVVRLHKGGGQVELIYFRAEVLQRYFAHPETYELHDSITGGCLMSRSSAADCQYAYVRYGKRKAHTGQTLVTAILKDLADMSPEEQRYWHSFELRQPLFSGSDPAFKAFVLQNFEAEWVAYPDPLAELLLAMKMLNESKTEGPIFRKLGNAYLYPPVENTYKSFARSCTELYKLVGPDNIEQKTCKLLLVNRLARSDSDFVHSSGSPKSTLQLLSALTKGLDRSSEVSELIATISQHRVDDAHKIIEPSAVAIENYIDTFNLLCGRLARALHAFRLSLSRQSHYPT